MLIIGIVVAGLIGSWGVVVDPKDGEHKGRILERQRGQYEVYDPETHERKAYGRRSPVNPDVIEFFDAKTSKRLYELRMDPPRGRSR